VNDGNAARILVKRFSRLSTVRSTRAEGFERMSRVPGVADGVVAKDEEFAGGRPNQAGNAANQCRLAGAVRACALSCVRFPPPDARTTFYIRTPKCPREALPCRGVDTFEAVLTLPPC
jgi:hypothetical protein